MNKDTDNQSSSINTKLSVCFSILIISIIILIFCDTDTICSLYTYVYTFIFVSISYLFIEYKSSTHTNKAGGFVDKIELFNYTRDDIENEKKKLETQNEDISNIMDKYDGFERYNGSNTKDVVNFKGLNDLSMEELQTEASDLLRVTRTDFMPMGLKKILLSKINDILSFSDSLINKISKSNSWAPNDKVFNIKFIEIVKKAYLDSKKGRSYININNISERFLNEDFILNIGLPSVIKENINMLEKNVIFNDEILSQCCKLLYCMIPREQNMAPGLACTDYYYSWKLISESDDKTLENNINLHSEIIKFFESLMVKNFSTIEEPSISTIKCNIEKTGSAELTPEESRKLGLLKEMEFLGLDKDQRNTMNMLLEKQGKVSNSTGKLTDKESKELATLAGKVRWGLSSVEKTKMDRLLAKQGTTQPSNVKSITTPVTSTRADSKLTPSNVPRDTKKSSKPNTSTSQRSTTNARVANPQSESKNIKTKEISTVESIKEVEDISEDSFKNGTVSAERKLLEDKFMSDNKDRTILPKISQTLWDEENGINVFSRNLLLRKPNVILLNKEFDGDKTNPFDGQLQDKKYNEFRDKIYKLYMYNINDLHLRFIAHFITNKKRLSELSSIDDKCLERINKIGEKVKTLEEEIITAKGIKEELEVLKIIAQETNELRGAKFELEAQLKEALESKGSWKSTQELEQKTTELQAALSENQAAIKKIEDLNKQNAELMVSSVDLRSESSSLRSRLQNISEERELLIKENTGKDTEIVKLKNKIEDLNYRLEYLTKRENRIIAETKFSDKILNNIHRGRSDVRKIINIVETLKKIVVDKYKSHKGNLNSLNKKISGTVNKLEQSLLGINKLAERTKIINSFYSKDKIKKQEKTDVNISVYKNQIGELNVQMNQVRNLLKPFFITNGTGFEYLKQHLENLNNEKKLIKEELSEINFSILSNELNSKDINFAEFVGKYNNELNIKKRIKLFKRLSYIDTELYSQYGIIERYNNFVDMVFKEFKKVESVNKISLFESNEFIREYEFLALNYRNYILKYNKVVDLNTTLLSKNSILSKKLSDISLENKILGETISSKEPDKLIITMKDEIVRLNSEIDKYYKNNSKDLQDLEELKQNLNQSMLENSDLKDTILNLEKEIELVKEDYKKKLESAVDSYAVELNNDLDAMVILLNGSNNIDWNTNNVEVSNTKKKQLFIISKIKELLLSNDNSKRVEIELEKMKKTIKSLNEEAERKNIIISELREAISSGKEFVNSSGVMSSSNIFKTNSELYEEEKLKLQKNIKLLEIDKKKILEDLDYVQTVVEKSNKDYRTKNEDINKISKNIAKASDYISTPLGYHTKNALAELFKCISSNSMKKILFHKLFKGFFTKTFAKEFSMQTSLRLDITNLGDTNIFSEGALNEIYNYITDDEGNETNIFTDPFSNYLKKVSNISGGYDDDDDGFTAYMEIEDEPDRWDFDNDDEYDEAVKLFKQKKNKPVESESISRSEKSESVIKPVESENKLDDIIGEDSNLDAGLIIMIVLEKLNVINKESEYYKNSIMPLFIKYRISENSFNDNNFIRKCFNSIAEDTDNYINKIRNVDLNFGSMTRSIIENSNKDDNKIKLLLSLEKYVDENMDDNDMIYNLYSLDKYENTEMDYLIAIIILDIKNYESTSKSIKIINSKLNNAEFMLKDVEEKLIDSIIPKVSHLNKNYFSIMDSLKSMIFKDSSRADTFIKRKLNQLSKKKDYNKFDEIQAIIITKLKEDYESLKNEIKQFEDKMDVNEKMDSNLYNTKGLLQVYQNKVSEISDRLQLYSSNVKEMTESITNTVSKIKSDKEKLNKANNQILKLNKLNEDLNEKLDKLMNQEKINLTEINSLNEYLERINNNIINSKKDKLDATSSITLLEKNINDTNTKIKECNNYIQQLDKRVTELSSIEIGRNRINKEIKDFIIDITPDINDNTALERLQIIKQKLDDNSNTVKEKEDEKSILTDLNNGLISDRDRIISDINKLLSDSIISDDKQWMTDMDSIGIKLDIINKFIEKWENSGNEKIRSLIELLQKNKQVSAELITKLNTDISDIADIDFIIQKIKPSVKKPEELVVKYDSDLIEYRDALDKAVSKKNLLEKEVERYMTDRRNKIIFINELDTKLHNYIDENNYLKLYIDNILSKYNETTKEKEAMELSLKNVEDNMNSKSLEILSLNEEIQKQKDTIFEMSKTIEVMESSSKSMIDRKQCSDYIKNTVDPIIEILSDKITSVKEITKLAEFISNRWNKDNLDISKYIQKNKILEEEIKRLANVNIEYEKNISDFKSSEEKLKNLTMILKLFINKSDKNILEQLKINNLNSFNNTQELEKYLNAKISLSTEIVEGFRSVVNNYESIRNIFKDKELANNINSIISKCNEYKKILSSKNIKNIENINEILLSKEELENKINEIETELSINLIERNKQIDDLKDQIRNDKYVDDELNNFKFDNNSISDGNIKYVQTIINISDSIIKKEKTDVNENDIIEQFKSDLEGMLILSKKYLSEEDHNIFNGLYNNLTIESIVEMNPLIKSILRNIKDNDSYEGYESKKKEIVADLMKYNDGINDKIDKIESTFKSNMLITYDKLDRYKLLFLKASDGIKKYTNDINKSTEIIDSVRNKITKTTLELNASRKQIDEILNDKRKAIKLNKKLKNVETITVDTANKLQSNIDSYNKDITKIQIYLREIVDYTKNLKEEHAKLIDELLSSKDKSDEEKQQAVINYNRSLENIETVDKALKECNHIDSKYNTDVIISINQLKTDLLEAKKLVDVSLIDLDKFSRVVGKSIGYVYDSIQEINAISAMTGKLKEIINKKLSIKGDASIINDAMKNKKIYNKIIKDLKSPIEKQIMNNRLLAIELSFVKNSVDTIATKYKDSIIKKCNSNNIVCKKETKPELRIVEEIIYVDRNNNIIMPNNINVNITKKVKEPVTDYDKYRKQLVKQ